MPGAGVDIDAVVAHVWMRNRRMPVNDQLAVVMPGVKEVVTYPEEVGDDLPIERNHRTNTGMHEQVIAAANPRQEAFQEEHVCTRQSPAKLAVEIVGRCRVRLRTHAVGGKRWHAPKL